MMSSCRQIEDFLLFRIHDLNFNRSESLQKPQFCFRTLGMIKYESVVIYSLKPNWMISDDLGKSS